MASGVAKLRSVLYRTARGLGDVRAVQTGTVGKRLVRRAVGSLTARALSRLFR